MNPNIKASGSCTNCDSKSVGRRRFLKASAATLLLAPAMRSVHAAPSLSSRAETVAAELFESLNDSQRAEICRPFADALRSKVNANWHVTKPLIGADFYSDSQRGMIKKIVQSVTSESGFELINKQMDDDDGGLSAYSIAIFGDPKQKEFQWVLTGRHLTLRADGNTLAGTAFGGPMVYGHGEESSAKDNLFYYQTQKVNEVYAALDESQRAKALLDKAPAEAVVPIQGKNGKFPGLGVHEMSQDQQSLVASVLKTVLGPYRAEDGEEAMQLIEQAGGFKELRFAFYRNDDLQADKIWDNWRIEGPNSVIHFRGSPHVHAYIHIAASKA